MAVLCDNTNILVTVRIPTFQMLPASICLSSSAFVSDYRSGANRARRVNEFLAEYREGRTLQEDRFVFAGVPTRVISETIQALPLTVTSG